MEASMLTIERHSFHTCVILCFKNSCYRKLQTSPNSTTEVCFCHCSTSPPMKACWQGSLGHKVSRPSVLWCGENLEEMRWCWEHKISDTWLCKVGKSTCRKIGEEGVLGKINFRNWYVGIEDLDIDSQKLHMFQVPWKFSQVVVPFSSVVCRPLS